MSSPPRILVTNDDGVNAPGLEVLISIARAISKDVTVVAPAHNQSGAGHRFTLGTEMQYERVQRNVYALDGSPADCVVLGMTHILKDNPADLVLSGVNQGQNLGDIINCSGTVAGAREGALHGAMGIALSQAVDYEGGAEIDWTPAKTLGAEVVRTLLAAGPQSGPGTYFNVNFPIGSEGAATDIRVVPHQRFARSPFAYYASRNEGRFFVAIPETPKPIAKGHDFDVLHREQAVTVTPLRLALTDEAALERLRGAFAQSGRGG